MELTPRFRRQYYSLIVGIILYNNWLLGLFLNWQLTRDGATISELSIPGQPWSMVFRICDVLAGLALLGGIGLFSDIVQATWQKIIIYVAMAVFGLGTIIDALIPLNCSAVLSKACAQYEQIGRLNGFHLFHIAESLLVYIFVLLLPLIILVAGKQKMSPKRFKFLWAALLVSILVWALSTVARYVTHSEAYGYEQRGFTLLFSAWFLYILIRVRQKTIHR